MHRIIWKSLITLCIAADVFSTNYYVSSSLGNDSNNGTMPGAAWATLNRLNEAWGSIAPGDSILFKRGDIFAPESVGSRIGLIRIPNNLAGKNDQWIVIGAYGSGAIRPVISGENCKESYFQSLRTGSCSYIVIENIEFRGEILFRPVDNVAVGINHLRFRNNRIQGGLCEGTTKITFYNPYKDASGNFINSLVPRLNSYARVSHIEIGGCEFFDTEGEDAVNIGKSGDSLWIHHNVWKNISEEALDIGGGIGHVIEYNFVSGTSVNGMKFHSQSNPQGYLIVRGNVIIGNNSSANGIVFQNVFSSKIFNNTIFNPYAAYFGNRDRVPPESYYSDFKGNEIFNNIFCGVVQIQGSWNGANIGDSVWYSAPVTSLHKQNTFTHNCYWSYSPGGTLIRFWENGQYPDENALVNDTRTINSLDTMKFRTDWSVKAGVHEYCINPQFVNPVWKNGHDYGSFRVIPGSVSAVSGKSSELWTRDITGATVPSDRMVSIGAYQCDATSTRYRHLNINASSQPYTAIRIHSCSLKNGVLSVEYETPAAGHIQIAVFDLSGRVAARLNRGVRIPGTQRYVAQCQNVSTVNVSGNAANLLIVKMAIGDQQVSSILPVYR